MGVCICTHPTPYVANGCAYIPDRPLTLRPARLKYWLARPANVGVYCTLSFYYPRDRMAKALRTLEACCTPFAPNSATPRQFVIGGEVASVTSQPVSARYVGPDRYYEPWGSHEDDPILGRFKGAVVDFDTVPEQADGVSVMYDTTLVLPEVPVLPSLVTLADWQLKSEGRGEFGVVVMVRTEGDYGSIDLTSSTKRGNDYILRSRPVRVRALAFAHATGALLALEDCEGAHYELSEEYTGSGGREPDASWRLTTALHAFGALPGAG